MNKLKTLCFILRFYGLFAVVRFLTLYYKIIGTGKREKDVLYLESLTFDGAGYTYRVKYWEDILKGKGMEVESLCVVPDAVSFFSESTTDNLQTFILKNIKIRIKQIRYSRNFKCVIVRRNLVIYNQYGNHFMEQFLRVASPDCILDFDDDIGAQEPTRSPSLFHRIMNMSSHQFYGSFDYYKGFICGSDYLKDLVLSKKSTENIVVIPTCVNYTDYPQKKYQVSLPSIVTFGWIGGNHNLFLLEKIIPSLNQLHKEFPLQLLVIAGVNDYPFHADFKIVYDQFSLETEIESLMKMDIGLMPLEDDEISRGKCGFKLLQYMGVGIPGIASAVTVNNEIIDDGENGWLVQNEDEWYSKLREAIQRYPEFDSIGHKATDKVDKNYSFKTNSNKYYNFIQQNIA